MTAAATPLGGLFTASGAANARANRRIGPYRRFKAIACHLSEYLTHKVLRLYALGRGAAGLRVTQ
jgi:hypothetical protein